MILRAAQTRACCTAAFFFVDAIHVKLNLFHNSEQVFHILQLWEGKCRSCKMPLTC